MNNGWKRSLSRVNPDHLWFIGLLLASLLLYLVNLGGLPLRDWDEGTVAQVAREIWRSPSGWLAWLHPTIWGEPYFNKPPLVHGLIAIAYRWGGVNEWTSRLPSALLTAVSVPLLYGLGRELFYRRMSALLAALIYLTMLPVVRHGRLTMLDGAILCFLIALIWCVLRSRRDSRFALGIGFCLALICLTKGVLLGVLLGAIAGLFLLWDTPRLLTSPWLWLGLLLGGAPVGVWYGAQWFYYGNQFLGDNLFNQSVLRIWTPVEDNPGPPWYYLLELLKYGLPWIVFLPQGFRLAWEHRNLSWARLVLVWSGVYFVTVSLMATKLPWYILPVYPAIALVCGATLTHLWDAGRHNVTRQTPADYSRWWAVIFAVLAIAAWGGSLYFGLIAPQADRELVWIAICMALTLTVVAVMLARHNPQFLVILIWGSYLALLMLMLSSHWVWELAESYPVRPIAHMLQTHTPIAQPIYTSNRINRPSLSFYSDRPVIPSSQKQLQRLWQAKKAPYLLLDADTLKFLNLKPRTVLGITDGWILITRVETTPKLP